MVDRAAPAGVTVIRSPGLTDADGIADVQVQGWREAYSLLLPSRFYDEGVLRSRQEMWRKLLSQEDLPARLRIAERDGEVVGVALAAGPPAGESARELHLYLIYLRSQVYGMGVGQSLLEAVIGAEPAELWVAKENPRAIAFYRRNGFAPDGVEKADPEINDLMVIRLVR